MSDSKNNKSHDEAAQGGPLKQATNSTDRFNSKMGQAEQKESA